MMHTTKQAGFTIIELTVSLAIMVAIISIVLFNYKSFDGNVVLTNLAYDVALTIRRTQSYGTSVKGDNNDYSKNYGIYFNISFPKEYKIFIDANTNGKYDGSDPILETYNFKSKFEIQKVCMENGTTDYCRSGQFSAIFKRPNPEATIYWTGRDESGRAATFWANEAYITLYSTSNASISRAVTVNKVGQITVK